MAAWVLVVEAVDVRHQEEVVGIYHGGGNGGESVIVTEFDLGDSQSVVLVNDGDHAHAEEFM